MIAWVHVPPLIDRLPDAREPHPNRVSEEVETAILLAHALDHQPTARCGLPRSCRSRAATSPHRRGSRRVVSAQAAEPDRNGRTGWRRLPPNAGSSSPTSRLPLPAVYLMNNDALPSFEVHRAKIDTVLSDNGREFRGRPDRHPYELFLQLEEIEQQTAKVRRPQSNGFVKRIHRTLLDKHFRVTGRKKFYDGIEAMQTDLDAYLAATIPSSQTRAET